MEHPASAPRSRSCSSSSRDAGGPKRVLAAPLATVAPIVLEGRYRLLMGTLMRIRHSRRSRWGVAIGSGACVLVLALLAVRHFATTSWPLSGGEPGLLVAGSVLLLVAQGLKAYGWGRLFVWSERPKTLALAAGNGGAALIGVVLPGRFDDAMRVAVVRRRFCRESVRECVWASRSWPPPVSLRPS